MLSRVVTILLICFGLGHHANAQQWFLTLITPPSVTVSNNLTYSMALENESGFFLNPVLVTNVFPTSLQFVGATSNGTTVTVAPGRVVFNITSGLTNGQTFPFTLTLRPTQIGPVTNVVTATTPATVENITLQGVTVVNAPVARSDLSVSITPPPPPIFAGDWVPYSINVMLNGPDPIPGVVLTTTIPSGGLLQGYSPSNGASVSGQQLTFDLGTVLVSTQVNVTVQLDVAATNIPLSARITTPAGTEINTNNNLATNTITVLQGVPGQLTAEVVPGQFFNRQNALFEQLIRVSNNGTSSVPSARVILSNFNFRVVNAVGTNNGFPFVVHAGTLATNQTTELLLEYFFPDRTPHEEFDLVTYPAGTIDLSPPTGGTNIAITNIFFLPPNDLAPDTNRVLLQFPATPGARYVITYMTNMSSGARKALPPLVAQANYVNWIDYGPPKTISRPVFGEVYATNTMMITNMMDTNMVTLTNIVTTNLSMRLYQAIQLP